MLVGVAIFMAAFVKCCAVHTPSSNPNKKPALRISDTLQHTLRRKVSPIIFSKGSHFRGSFHDASSD